MAGPLSPPTMFDSRGRRVSTSIAMARNVFTSDTASAPASSAARAKDATSVTFGVSLGMTGSAVTLRTALTTACVPVRLQPNVIPPSLMFGQEMFSSSAATPSAVREDSRQLDVLVDRRAADVDDHDRAAIAQLGQLLPYEPVHADALEPDRVEHPRGRLDDARRRMPLALAEEQALDGDSAERREVDHVAVLDAVAETAARGNHRIGQAQRSDGNREIHSQCASASHTTRAASNTGPSRQERTKCGEAAPLRVSTTQL